MTTRRGVFIFALLLAACRRSAPADELLPASAGAWKRGSVVTGATVASAAIPASSIRRTLTATYTGGGTAEVTLYELTSSGVSLDAVQRWRPAADTVFFNRDAYFVVVKYREADRKLLQALLRDLERALTPRQ